MDKIKQVLDKQFGIKANNVVEIISASWTMNYKITDGTKTYFFKMYDKSKTQTSLWTENIDTYIPILFWLNENTDLRGRITSPYKTTSDEYLFEDDENIFLLFDYIEGETVGNSMMPSQLTEAAEILATLHNISHEIPFNMDKLKEDFSVPFCHSLEEFITDELDKSPADIKSIMLPYLKQLVEKNDEVKMLAEKFKAKTFEMALCHVDAHGNNLMQGERLVLVDWEMIKFAPVELDLIMFTKKEYWDIFIKQYQKLRPSFILDNDLLKFYVHRRNIEDTWAYIESITYDKQSVEQRRFDLNKLLSCLKVLDDDFFAI